MLGDLTMTDLTRQQCAVYSWLIEYYDRVIELCTEVKRCSARSVAAQRNHIGPALRAFLRPEVYGFADGVSRLEAKTAIIHDATRSYLAHRGSASQLRNTARNRNGRFRHQGIRAEWR